LAFKVVTRNVGSLPIYPKPKEEDVLGTGEEA